jgi:hypothetical protein
VLHQRVVRRALRQLVGKYRRRQVVALRRLARREQRDQPARAVDQLQVGDDVAQLLDGIALEQRLALDDDQHVVFARGKPARDLLVLSELGRVAAEQLAERIVDLQPIDAERRAYRQGDQNQQCDIREV